MGAEPRAADASVFGMVSGLRAPIFETPIRDAARSLPNLVAYRDRIMERYFPAAS